MALRNLLVRVGADLSNFSRGMNRAQGQLNNFSRNVSRSMKAIGATMAALGAGMGLGSAINDAMKVEASMQQINRLMGESANEFMKWKDSVGSAFGYSTSEAIRFGAIYGNLITTFSKNTTETQQMTQKLLETTAVISSATGRSMEDVSERIRSGMLGNTESIEDLGVNVQVAMLESTEAFRKFANDQSWNQLDFQTKQQVLYYGILEQAAKKYGTEVADNTASRLGSFVAALNNTKLALGQAFLPIIYNVLPSLTALANKLASVMNVIAQFSRALFGSGPELKQQQTQVATTNAQTDAVSGLGSAIKKAGKEAKKASHGVAGFDEINQLTDTSSTSGGSGGGGGGTVGGGGVVDIPLDSGEAEGAVTKISKKVKEMADKFKKFMAPVGKFFKKIWDEVSGYFSEKVKGMVKFWDKYGSQFLKALSNIWKGLKPIISWIVDFIWTSIKGVIDGVIKVFEGIVKFISGVFTGDWKTAFSGIKDIIFGAFEAVWNFLSLTIFGGIRKALVSLISNFGKSFTTIVTKIKTPFNKIGDWFKTLGDDMWKKITFAFKYAYSWFKTNVGDKVVAAISSVKTSVTTKADEIWVGIKGKFGSVSSWFTSTFQKIPSALSSVFGKIGSVASTIWSKIKAPFSSAYSWFKTNVVDKISSAFSRISTSFRDIVTSGFKSVINKAISGINSAISGVNSVKNKIPGIKNLPNIPRIPALAKGGITNGPTLALIGDNPGGKEVVSPLDDLQDIIASAVSTAVMSAMRLGGGQINNGDVVLQIDGKALGRVLNPYIDKEKVRVGSTMIKPI